MANDIQLDKWGKPRLKSGWVGLWVETLVPLQNRNATYPRGMICKVTGYQRGLRLITAACPHCGVAVYITKVPLDAVGICDNQNREAPDARTYDRP